LIKIIAILSTLFVNLFSAITLIATSSKNLKNRFYLGLFFFNSFILFVGHFLSFNEYWNAFKYYDFIFLASLLAFYPLYYLYIYSAFNFKIVPVKWLYHFIPSILIAVLMFIITTASSWESYLIYMNNNLYNTELIDTKSKILAYLYKGSRGFHMIQIIVYNFLTIRFILKAKTSMNDSFSNLDTYQLRYFYIATISFILLMSIPGFYVTYIGRTPLNTNGMLLFYVCLLFTFLYLILTIIGLIQVPSTESIDTELENNEIQNQELKDVEKKLKKYFSKEKPWLNPNLNIWDVAQEIGTNRSYISKVVNENIGCNFNKFVNNYRIKEAKKILLKKPEIPITEISELSGFGSLNSFIRTFKESENCTPTKFKRTKS
jgi:AraC-like DNA-binding protein